MDRGLEITIKQWLLHSYALLLKTLGGVEKWNINFKST